MRFPRTGVAFAALVALAAAGCNEGLINSPERAVLESGAQAARPRFSSSPDAYPPPGTPCGAPLVADLKMGATKVGTVTIQNEGSKLFVIYHTNSPYFMSETRTAVAAQLADIPRDHRGYGDPWSYPYAGDHEPVESDWYYTILYDDWGFQAGQQIVVSVMAGVVYPTTSNWSGTWAWKQAWMVGQPIHPASAR